MLRAVAVAIKIQTTPAALLSSGSQGWGTVRKGIIRQIPGDAAGVPTIQIRADAFEWEDVTLFGWGNLDDGLQQLDAAIHARGSALYAYALFKRTDVDFLGVKAIRYRLVLVHSFVELAEWAVAIVAIAFAAIIFIQYVTTGQAPALKDLQALWGSAVTSVGQAGGQVVGAATNAYITAAVAVGAIAIAFGVISKQLGTKTPPGPKVPGGSIGVRAGGVSARVGA
jgi:hypothetical protein